MCYWWVCEVLVVIGDGYGLGRLWRRAGLLVGL